MRSLLVLCVALLPMSQAYAQLSKPYSSRWQTRIVFGTDMPIKNFPHGNAADYLVGYDSHAGYLQIFNSSLFFSRHWGLDAGYQIQMPSTETESDFHRQLETEYGDAYYVTSFVDGDGGNGHQGRGNLGLIYRFESKRLLVYPKFSIGFTNFETNSGTAYLKEKNANTITQVRYEAKQYSRTPFTFIPSVSLGYRVRNRIAVNVDIAGAYFKSNIAYTKQTRDLYSEVISTEKLSMKRNALVLTVGLGIVFTIYEKDGK